MKNETIKNLQESYQDITRQTKTLTNICTKEKFVPAIPLYVSIRTRS